MKWTWVCESHRPETEQTFTYSIPEKRDYGRCVDVGAMYVVLCTEVIALQCREMR